MAHYSRETWYDRKTRSWVTQILDEGRNQIGAAYYDGNRDSRDASIRDADEWIKSNEDKEEQ